jgi:hypothetical protein
LTPGANQVHIAIVARFMSRPGEIRWAALSFGRHNEQTARLLPLLMRRLRAPSPQLPLVLPETHKQTKSPSKGSLMTNVVQLRDFKRREENESADVRLAKQMQDTAPCELPNVWPDFQHSNGKDPA